MAARGAWLPVGMRAWWRSQRTTAARQPVAAHRLMLLPTRFGIAWAVLIPLLLLFGINYQNNLAYGLAFWLFSIALVSVWRGWRNLLGVRLDIRPRGEVFAGDNAMLEVSLTARRKRQALSVILEDRHASGDLSEGSVRLALEWQANRRGEHRLPPVRLYSLWPLGMVRVVAWVDSGARVLIYPRPDSVSLLAARARAASQEALDFSGLRRYQRGDSPARLAWKQYSRSGVLATKAFEPPPLPQRWLDYDTCRGDPEARLSMLCAWALEHHRQGDRYGLRLPGVEVAPGSGEAHRQHVLRTLALWQAPDSEGGP